MLPYEGKWVIQGVLRIILKPISRLITKYGDNMIVYGSWEIAVQCQFCHTDKKVYRIQFPSLQLPGEPLPPTIDICDGCLYNKVTGEKGRWGPPTNVLNKEVLK